MLTFTIGNKQVQYECNAFDGRKALSIIRQLNKAYLKGLSASVSGVGLLTHSLDFTPQGEYKTACQAVVDNLTPDAIGETTRLHNECLITLDF